MEVANRRGARYAVVIGQKEVRKGRPWFAIWTPVPRRSLECPSCGWGIAPQADAGLESDQKA